MPKIYTVEQKKQWIEEYRSGKSVKAICEENHISKNSLYAWIKLFETRKGKKGTEISGHRIVTLEQQNQHLQEMFDISRICEACPSSQRKDKLIAAERLVGKYSIRSICEYLELPRGTYYNYIKSKEKVKIEDLKDNEFKSLIKAVFEKSEGRMSASGIRYRLKIDGYRISSKRVKRLMDEIELVPISAKETKYYYNPSSFGRKNKLKRRFNQTEPNKVWASDFTYIFIDKKQYYLCVVLDLFSRKVLAYNLSDQCNADLVLKPAKEAFEKRGKPESLMFHSDLGLQYTSYEFFKLLRKWDIDQSFSRPGNPLDNAVAESFFATYKKEELYKKEFLTFDELAIGVAEYIDYYNNYRPHKKCGYLSPTEFEQDYENKKNP